ncbi:hypothetical protein Tco_0683173 [Tanacetum coccineum]|uniref:Uncharacterized protein n=1 Tax=Tanacetum coccineum TaxID=301880 RepID=A0ABQ4XT92_9ASTR
MPGLVESSSLEFDLFSDIEENLEEEETTKIMTEIIEQYMSKTRGNYGSGVARPKTDDKTHIELIRIFLKELHENTFSSSELKDANKHIEKVLKIVDLFHIPELTQDQIMLRAFPMSLTGAMSRWLRNEPSPYAEAREVKILETYNNTLPQKEKDLWSITLPCFIHNVYFDKALVNLGASVSVMPFSTYTNLGLDVFKRKFTLRVGEEKLVFKSIKPATSIIRRVYVLKKGMDLDSKTKFIGEAINESFDPHYDNYIELNDLDMPLEPRMDQDDEFKPTLNFINEPTYKNCYKMKFSCMIRYKHVIVDSLPTLSINMMTKHFYNSIIKDKCDHEGKNLAGTLIDLPIFVGNSSIISGNSIINDMDIISGVVLGIPFCKKFVSCQKIMKRFAHGDKCERMDDE